MEPYLTAFLSAVSTLAASFFGAKYAFDLQELRQSKETALQHVTAGNGLISAVSRTRNKFVAFRAQSIALHQESPVRRFEIPPLPGVTGLALQIEYASLDFFFASSDPDFIGRLSMLEQEVASTLELMELRSQFHYHGLQPIVEALEATPGLQVTEQEIDRALGPRDALALQSMTDQMIESVNDVVDASEKICADVNQLLKRGEKGSGGKGVGGKRGQYPLHSKSMIKMEFWGQYAEFDSEFRAQYT